MKALEDIIDIFDANPSVTSELLSKTKDEIFYAHREVLLVNSDDYSVTIRKKAFGNALAMVSRDSELDVVQRWGILLGVIYATFVQNDYDEFAIALRKTYYSVVKRVEEYAWRTGKVNSEMFCIDKSENAPIVIVTSQFLSKRHAPTRRVLDYAYTITHDIGIPTIIINDASMYCSSSWILYNFMTEYNNISFYSYKGIEFPFYQESEGMNDTDAIILLWNRIRDLRPRMVLNVGAYSIVADMCRLFTKTASIPCAMDIPVSMSEYLLLPRDYRDTDRIILDALLPYQKVVKTRYNYVYPREGIIEYSRSDLSIKENAFVIAVIGNRLDMEMDSSFLHAVEQVLVNDENIVFMMIGEVINKKRVIDIIKKEKQLCFAGYIENAGDCLRIVDVCINPRRIGGGRAAFEALYHGKPVITLKYGDVWGTTGDDFAVKDYQEMINQIMSLKSNTKYYNMMRQKAIERASVLENVEQTFRELFDKLDVME